MIALDPLREAQRLAPTIAARADEIEEARRLPADLADEMARAGLFRLIVPKSLGGSELHPRAVIETLETVAAADASAGWCAMIAATTGLVSAYLEPAVAREIYADPRLITGGVFAPMGKAVREGGAYVVTGRWKWASGSQNCAWLGGGCVIIENGAMLTLPSGAPNHRMILFPREEVELIDTWRVAGLKGTGSGDMRVEGVRAPVAHSVSLIVDKPVEQGALYAFPAFGLLALGIAAVASGNARAAIADFIALAQAKKPGGGKRTLAERGAAQAALAQAEAGLRGARAFLMEAVDRAWAAAERGDGLSQALRADLRLAATHLVRVSAETVRVCYDLAGGDSVFLDSPLQRRFRDAHVATQHMMTSAQVYELAGRILFGLPTDDATL